MPVGKKTLVAGSILFALAFIPIAALNQPSLRSQAGKTLQTTEPVQLHVTVTGKQDAFVNRLQENDFEVLVDKKPTRIVSFRNQDSPASIGIIFDSSGSMRRDSSKKTTSDFFAIREAISQFLKRGHEDNDYFLMAFNIRPQLLVDWTSDPGRLIDSFNNIAVVGNSALYDACYVGIDKLQHGRHSKRILVLISDGQDNSSLYTFNQLRDLIRTTGVVVYSIHFSGQSEAGSALGAEGRAIVRELSRLSGGAVYPKGGPSFYPNDTPVLKAKEISAALGLVADELRHQYSISILPGEETRERKWRKIKVIIKAGPSGPKEKANMKTKTREGLY